MFAVLTGNQIRNLGKTTTTTLSCQMLPFTLSSMKQHQHLPAKSFSPGLPINIDPFATEKGQISDSEDK